MLLAATLLLTDTRAATQEPREADSEIASCQWTMTVLTSVISRMA